MSLMSPMTVDPARIRGRALSGAPHGAVLPPAPRDPAPPVLPARRAPAARRAARIRRAWTSGLFGAALALVAAFPGAAYAHDWNDGGIAWQDYTQGLAAAAKEGKPVCLVFFTEWCGHCAAYSKVFHDPAVIERSKKFVMVRVDRDKARELSKQMMPDGEYIPRTYFLSPAGKMDPDLHAARDQFKYFYDESAPAALLGGMEAALKKLGSPAPAAKDAPPPKEPSPAAAPQPAAPPPKGSPAPDKPPKAPAAQDGTPKASAPKGAPPQSSAVGS